MATWLAPGAQVPYETLLPADEQEWDGVFLSLKPPLQRLLRRLRLEQVPHLELSGKMDSVDVQTVCGWSRCGAPSLLGSKALDTAILWKVLQRQLPDSERAVGQLDGLVERQKAIAKGPMGQLSTWARTCL